MALAQKGLHGELALGQNLAEQMDRCFACLACNEACPVGIRPADLVMEMRRVYEENHPARWKESLFGGLIPKPGRMEAATWPLRLYENSRLRRLVYALRLNRILPARLRDLEAMLPRLSKRPLRQTLALISPAKNASRYRVGFFLGCAQSLLFAEESAATVRVLTRNGCTVLTPRETVCCGMPAEGYGRRDLVLDQARQNIALFEQVDIQAIITDCATCGSTLKKYGEFFEDDPEWVERARNFSAKVRDVSEFLAAIPLEKPPGRVEARVTYHDPCHLKRAQGVWKEPRALLRLIDGLELVELPEADWCCGSAGSQLITHYETSRKVLDRKIDNLEGTQAEYLASGCPGCQMQLQAGVRRHGLDVQVVHPITLLDRAYDE